MTDLEKKLALNKILLSYAETPHARELIIKNFITNEATVKDYVLALADGLLYGNWPWVSYSIMKDMLKDEKISDTDFKGISDALDDVIGKE